MERNSKIHSLRRNSLIAAGIFAAAAGIAGDGARHVVAAEDRRATRKTGGPNRRRRGFGHAADPRGRPSRLRRWRPRERRKLRGVDRSGRTS